MKASLLHMVTSTHLFRENLECHLFSPVVRDVNVINVLNTGGCRPERSESRRSLGGSPSAQMLLTSARFLYREPGVEGEKAEGHRHSVFTKNPLNKAGLCLDFSFNWAFFAAQLGTRLMPRRTCGPELYLGPWGDMQGRQVKSKGQK